MPHTDIDYASIDAPASIDFNHLNRHFRLNRFQPPQSTLNRHQRRLLHSLNRHRRRFLHSLNRLVIPSTTLVERCHYFSRHHASTRKQDSRGSLTKVSSITCTIKLHICPLMKSLPWRLVLETQYEDIVNLIVESGAVPALVRHLQAPESKEVVARPRPYEHEVEKGSAFTLGLLAIKPEHQQLIVDAGALPHLVALLKRHRDGQNSRAVNGVIRRAADAITNLAHENSSIKTCVRVEGGIPPLVELLEFTDAKVQRAAAGALRTLAFKNDENKTQIVDCNALPTLILMLRSEDAAIHYEAVGVIGNLVHSSPNIKKEVLLAGALQPVIELLR